MLEEDEKPRKVSLLCRCVVFVANSQTFFLNVETCILLSHTQKAPRTGLNTSLLLQKRHLGLLPENSYCRYTCMSAELISFFTLYTLQHPQLWCITEGRQSVSESDFNNNQLWM